MLKSLCTQAEPRTDYFFYYDEAMVANLGDALELPQNGPVAESVGSTKGSPETWTALPTSWLLAE